MTQTHVYLKLPKASLLQSHYGVLELKKSYGHWENRQINLVSHFSDPNPSVAPHHLGAKSQFFRMAHKASSDLTPPYDHLEFPCQSFFLMFFRLSQNKTNSTSWLTMLFQSCVLSTTLILLSMSHAMISSSSFKNLYGNYILPSPSWPLWPTEIIIHLLLYCCYSYREYTVLDSYFHIYPIIGCWS